MLGLSKVNEGRPNENTLSTKGEINALNPHFSPHTLRSQENAVSLLGKTARRGEKAVSLQRDSGRMLTDDSGRS